MLISGKSSAFLDHKKHFFKGAQSVRSNYIFFAQVAWKGSLVDGLAGWNKRGTLTYVSADQLFSSLCSNIFSDVVTSPLGGHFGEKCVITCLIFWSQPTLRGNYTPWGVPLLYGSPSVQLVCSACVVRLVRCSGWMYFVQLFKLVSSSPCLQVKRSLLCLLTVLLFSWSEFLTFMYTVSKGSSGPSWFCLWSGRPLIELWMLTTLELLYDQIKSACHCLKLACSW